MFRNPRENITRSPSDKFPPSVGRPPSPTRRQNGSMPNVASPAAISMEQPVVPRRHPAATPKKSVTTSGPTQNQNGNILNFFKKTGSRSRSGADGEESLFVRDNHFNTDDTTDVTALAYGLAENAAVNAFKHDNTSQTSNGDRYNESPQSIKRRKISADLKENGVHETECTPPPADFNSEANPQNPFESDEGRRLLQSKSKSAHWGPFLDDSDDDAIIEDAGSTEHMRRTRPPGDGTSLSNGHHDSRGETIQASFTSEAKPIDDNDRLIESTRDTTSLQREYTGIMDMEVFEGLEDFDDEYEGGEEILERRYMEEQLELELESGLGTRDIEKSARQAFEGMDGKPDMTSTSQPCPVCNGELSGLAEQDIMIHVNNCLDGKPTPIPLRKLHDDPFETEEVPSTDTKGVQRSGSQFKKPVRPPKPGQPNPVAAAPSLLASSAFSKLMSGHAEDEAWQSAAAAEYAARGKPAYQRTCPFYKILPGFFICVDAFRYGAVQGCNAYFLSHFHSDHYVGLTSTWSHGPIYCSKPTGNLVRQQLRVDSQYVIDLEFEKKVEVPRTQGVYVTMIPANHCPGSSLFLFEKTLSSGPKPRVHRVLHCGDFRACPAHIEHPLLKPEVRDAVTESTLQQRIDVCYLDTTYLNPKYAFPSQEDVIQACADMCVSLSKSKVDPGDDYETMKRERAGTAMTTFLKKEPSSEWTEGENLKAAAEQFPNGVEEPASKGKEEVQDKEGSDQQIESARRGRLLVIVGTYSIGKERICLGIARALKTKIYAPQNKQRIARALEDPELNALLTTDPAEGQVHMTPLFDIRAETLGEYLSDYRRHFDRAVGFRPSGWNYRPPGSRFTESPSVSMVLYSDSWKSSYTMRDLVPQRGSTSRAACYGVPYSEHSSFRELTMFCCALRIDKIIPTVNVGNAKSRERMKLWCERWAAEKRKNGLFRLANRDNPDPSHQWYAGKGTWELRTTL